MAFPSVFNKVTLFNRVTIFFLLEELWKGLKPCVRSTVSSLKIVRTCDESEHSVPKLLKITKSLPYLGEAVIIGF